MTSARGYPVAAPKEWFQRAISGGTGRENERPGVEQVLTKHAGRVMQIRGVMSMSVGRDKDGRPAIVVGVESDAPDACGELPEALDGVPVVRQQF